MPRDTAIIPAHAVRREYVAVCDPEDDEDEVDDPTPLDPTQPEPATAGGGQ